MGFPEITGNLDLFSVGFLRETYFCTLNLGQHVVQNMHLRV